MFWCSVNITGLTSEKEKGRRELGARDRGEGEKGQREKDPEAQGKPRYVPTFHNPPKM